MDRRGFLKGVAAAGMTAMAGEMFVPFAEATDIPKFNFVHITDLHLDVSGENSWQYREKSVPLFIDALRQITLLPKLNFVVFGGDQIHYGPNDKESLDVFLKWTAHLNMPYYILLGNTEVSPVSGVSKLGRDDYLKAWNGRGVRAGSSSWAFDPVRGVRVIGFDVTKNGKSHGEASAEGLTWLEHELKGHRDYKMIIIFTHQVLLPTVEKDKGAEWSVWMVKNHEAVRNLIRQYPNVRLAISGHHHASKVTTVGKVTYVSDPAIVTYPCAFRSFSVTRAGIHLRNVGIDNADAVTRARELLISDPYAKMFDTMAPQRAADYSVGLTPQDREAKIKL